MSKTIDKDQLKKDAAEQAAQLIQSGMALGLGTGSTAAHLVNAIGRRYKAGELTNIACIPTSSATADLATSWGLPLTDFKANPVLDLVIDGADEIDPNLNVIKGLGAALLWEKVVATAGKQFIIISDDSKNVTQLGELAPVPVEVIPFAVDAVAPFLESLGARPVLRQKDGQTVRTDENNIILDAHFGIIKDPQATANALSLRPGIVEHGLFLNMATQAFIASTVGVTHLTK